MRMAPDRLAQLSEFVRLCRSVLDDDRKFYVIVQRYGLDGQPPASSAELMEELGISRARVQQLEAAAIKKLQRGLPWMEL